MSRRLVLLCPPLRERALLHPLWRDCVGAGRSPFPAAATAEGRQFNGAPSPWERVRVRGFFRYLGTLRRHCVGAGSAATFTPALSQGEREQRPLAQPTDKFMLTLH